MNIKSDETTRVWSDECGVCHIATVSKQPAAVPGFVVVAFDSELQDKPVYLEAATADECFAAIEEACPELRFAFGCRYDAEDDPVYDFLGDA